MNVNQSAVNLLELTIEETVENAIEAGAKDVHKAIIELVEPQIYRSAMVMCKYNQSKAATALGVSRGTLRTKLKAYFGKEFI
jgi:DNA-binding protein Fis